MKLKRILLNISLTALTGMVATPWQSSANDLAATATNPIGDLVQVQLQYQYSPQIHGLDGDSHVGIVQPVIPFELPWKSVPTMITRTTIPYVSTPDLPGSGSVNGLGDTVVLALALPKLKTKGHMLGIGPALLAPTASKDETGSNAWALGPAAVYINLRTEKLMWGALGYGYWDVGGGDRDEVSVLNVQPILNKYFNDGWYLGLQDAPWTYNGETGDWSLPIGPRLGKVTKIGNQSVNVFAGAYYNPEDSTGNAEWTFKFSLSLLFPK